MAKITRYTGNLAAFASAALGTERTIFGDVAQADTLTDNIGTAEFLRGWGIVGLNDAPAKQDFNGLAYSLSLVLAYLHQVGVAEWDITQEYYAGSVVTHSDDVFLSLIEPNIGNDPDTSSSWRNISGSRSVVQTTDAVATAIATIAVPDNSVMTVEARISGILSTKAAACGGNVLYTARRAGAGAVEVAPAVVNVHDDSLSAPTIDADVDGNNIRLLVTGVVGETWDWVCTYNRHVV